MNILDCRQGDQAWHAHRAKSFNASDAPAMLGVSPYTTRNELLRLKHGGLENEVNAATQLLFDKGHQIEFFARPFAEKEIGDEFYPVTATDDDGWLSASFDGITINNDVIWECKTANETLRTALDNGDLPDGWWPQVEQQLLISGALFCLFTISDGTESGTRHMKYSSKPERRARLIAGWQQFQADIANYQPSEVIPAAVAAPQERLPAVSVRIIGSIEVCDKIKVFGNALTAYIERINQKPETDQDFANLDASAKTLKEAEEALTAAENNALGQVSSVDDLRRTVSQYRDLARSTRLTIEKLVKAEKENRRTAIINTGRWTLQSYIDECNKAIGKPYMPEIASDFAGAVKGLKTITSIQNAVDTELARAKIAARERADCIMLNIQALAGFAIEYPMLLKHEAQLVLKSPDDLVAQAKSWMFEQKERDRERLEQEREKIRAEEVARIEQEQNAAQPAVQAVQAPSGGQPQEPAVAAPAADDGSTIKLGDISQRLGFTVTTEFLSGLGFHARAQKNMRLYRECDFPLICNALIRHINAAAHIDYRKAA